MKLARRIDLSDGTLKFLETGRNVPSRRTLIRLLGVPELKIDPAEVPGPSLSLPRSALDPPGRVLSSAELVRIHMDLLGYDEISAPPEGSDEPPPTMRVFVARPVKK